MRLSRPDRNLIRKRVIKQRKLEVVRERKRLLQDPRIDELIARASKELAKIPEDILLFIGRHGDPAGMPKAEVIREKAAWILGIKLPYLHEVDEKEVGDEIMYQAITSKDIDELNERLNGS